MRFHPGHAAVTPKQPIITHAKTVETNPILESENKVPSSSIAATTSPTQASTAFHACLEAGFPGFRRTAIGYIIANGNAISSRPAK